MKITIAILVAVFGFSIAFAKDQKTETKKSTVEIATFAMGCFWCSQPLFDKIDGVIKTQVGFSGGKEKKTTYKEVGMGKTDHAEAIEITFDPSKVAYGTLLDSFWKNIDPTDGGGQFVDRGLQYRPAIFYHSDEQKKLAEESKKRLEASKKYDRLIAVQIEPYKFFVAVGGEDESVHDKYYQKNPFGYELYKKGSGREKVLKEIHK